MSRPPCIALRLMTSSRRLRASRSLSTSCLAIFSFISLSCSAIASAIILACSLSTNSSAACTSTALCIRSCFGSTRSWAVRLCLSVVMHSRGYVLHRSSAAFHWFLGTHLCSTVSPCLSLRSGSTFFLVRAWSISSVALDVHSAQCSTVRPSLSCSRRSAPASVRSLRAATSPRHAATMMGVRPISSPLLMLCLRVYGLAPSMAALSFPRSPLDAAR
mmetsp:Transcript_10867/g.26617  ORF Transcript_10867/g.26617 Transcript_10867/m.26617 type:complete len:217 (-) Transcript_10867:288-938(-)